MMFKMKVKEAGGVRAFAREHGLSAAYVSDVQLGRRGLSERLQVILGVQIVIPEVRYIWRGRRLPR